MTSHSDAAATDNDPAAAVTVATVGSAVGDGAVATVTVTNPDDATIVAGGTVPKSSFPQEAGIQTQGQQD